MVVAPNNGVPVHFMLLMEMYLHHLESNESQNLTTLLTNTKYLRLVLINRSLQCRTICEACVGITS